MHPASTRQSHPYKVSAPPLRYVSFHEQINSLVVIHRASLFGRTSRTCSLGRLKPSNLFRGCGRWAGHASSTDSGGMGLERPDVKELREAQSRFPQVRAVHRSLQNVLELARPLISHEMTSASAGTRVRAKEELEPGEHRPRLSFGGLSRTRNRVGGALESSLNSHSDRRKAPHVR